jgi:hypothetical protein
MEWGGGLRERDDGSSVNNVYYKSSQNCHYESPQYNEYILRKKFLKKEKERSKMAIRVGDKNSLAP